MVMKDWVLVTGGVGYVGSHCVVKILEAGHNVAVMDNLANADIGRSKNLLALCKTFAQIISLRNTAKIMSTLFSGYGQD